LLLDNRSVANTFGKNARNFVLNKFNWDNLAEEFIDIIESSI
jgi:hypothetical protein